MMVMMKLVRSSRSFRLLNRPSTIGSSFFSTETTNSGSSGSSQSLFKRVSAVADPKASIVPVLDKWIEEGKPIEREAFQSLLQRMRNSKRFQHALQISQWMAKDSSLDQTPIDAATQLDLIFKNHGLARAEEYFNSISKQLKASQPYGALLNCYVKEKSVQKAETLMEEMKKMGFIKTPFAYNMLVDLYAQTGQRKKIDTLMEEIKEKGLPQDKFTWKNRLNACVTASDIDGIENILHQIEEDPDVVLSWKLNAIVASGYQKIGLVDKALAALKKVEEIAIARSKITAFEYLLTQYASAGQKGELLRIWNLYKTTGKVRRYSYSCMITYLGELDDIEGAEKILEEFESSCTSCDSRALNRLIVVYCKKGLLEKAELVVKKAEEKAAESGRAPDPSVWKNLATGYLEDKQIVKAVEMLKKALSVSKKRWKPSNTIVASCLEYFEGPGDVEGAEDFVKLLASKGPLNREVYHILLRTYVTANKSISTVLDRMKVDGLSADEDTQKLIEKSSDIGGW